MSITVKEIAQKAGVSPATVSLVINNKKGVSKETRLRVQAIMEQYDYRPIKNNKRSLCLTVVKFRKHGMALEENQGFVASIIDHMEAEARKKAIGFSVVNCDEQNSGEIFAALNADAPQGVIIIGTELSRPEYPLLKKLKIPFVILDNSMGYEDTDSVVMDNHSIIMKSTQYLYGCGHRQISYFKSSRQINNLDERYEGYLKAMDNLGLEVPRPVLLPPTLKGAYKEMRALLQKGAYVPGGAAVADNDSIAIGVLKAVQEAGYQVPDDLSVIGVDDIPFSAVTTPGLTTMRISRQALGELGLEVIQRRIAHPDWPSIKVAIGAELIKRGSTRQKSLPRQGEPSQIEPFQTEGPWLEGPTAKGEKSKVV